MSEVVEAPAQVDTAPTTGGEDSVLSAFANARQVAPEPQQAVPASEPPAAVPQASKESVAPDYTPLLKELGYETPEALKERLATVKDYDPQAVERLTANQRDDHDKAVREMLADPAKARAYFELQTMQPDVLAAGTPAQQRELLFEDFKLKNPQFTGKLAQFEFEDEYERKYALAEEGDADDPATERAKLHLEAALKLAAPAMKAAQDAAKVAVLPKPAEAQGPTQEQQDAWATKWNEGVTAVLAKPTVEQAFQVDGQPVTVGFDTKSPEFKEFASEPLGFMADYLKKLAYPDGPDKPANMEALAQAYGRLTQPDAIARAAAAHAKTAIGAHVLLTTLSNPAPEAPQPASGAGGGSVTDAFAAAAARRS